jgi:hypothetical protein
MPPSLPSIKGFDRQGEPELRAGENGALELVFNFMPPMTAAGEERAPDLFEHFEKVLSAHLGVTVTRDDREVFLIPQPKPETAAQLADYLSTFWKNHAKPLKTVLAAVPRDPKARFKSSKEAHETLKVSLAPLMKPLGFKPAKFMDLTFRRKTEFGNEMITISAMDQLSHFRTFVHIFVTHDVVENIYAFASGMEHRFLKSQFTTSGPLEGIGEGQICGRLVRPLDVEGWVAGFIKHFKSAGLAEIARRGDLSILEAKTNDLSVSRPDYLEHSSPDKIAGTGLIIAKLLGRPNLDGIAAFHRNQLATQQGVNVFPQTEPVIMGLSRDELIARGNAFAKQKV